MNDIIFSNSFFFHTFNFGKSHYTDNRKGSPCYYFAYMLSGKCKIVSEYETVYINEGDFFFIPDKLPYQSFWYGNPTVKFISLGFKFLPNFENNSYPAQTIKSDERSCQLFREISHSARTTAEDIGKFYTLAARLLPHMRSHRVSRAEEIVYTAKNYIFEYPEASVSEIAQKCAVSEASLYSSFKKSSDISLNTMRNGIVLERAKELIISTDKPIEQISNLLGFSSASYFRKKFKEYFNVTPTEMRKKLRI